MITTVVLELPVIKAFWELHLFLRRRYYITIEE